MINLVKAERMMGEKLQKPHLGRDIFVQRCSRLFETAGCDWVIIYGDREHYANLVYLCGFDPRFEEAILVLGMNSSYLIVGNEGMGHLPYTLKTDAKPVLCRTMSLQGQPRDENRNILKCFEDIGVSAGDCIGVVGWKYTDDIDRFEDKPAYFVPQIYINAIERAAGSSRNLRDVTALLTDASYGMKSVNEPEQILMFEWAAVEASESVHRMIANLQVGMTEFEAAAYMGFSGEPFSMYSILTTGKFVDGLNSPGSKRIELGEAGIACVGYWGGTTARAGVIAYEDDFFIENVAKPYFNAIIWFYENMKVGGNCGAFFKGIADAFGNSGLRSALNPGHLGSYDEWMNSPIYKGSDELFHSGAVFQVDVIPVPLPSGCCANCEDTIALADEKLRTELMVKYPNFYNRVIKRREYIRNTLGIAISEDILPLNDSCAYFQALWLKHGYVLAKS